MDNGRNFVKSVRNIRGFKQERPRDILLLSGEMNEEMN